MKKNVLLFRIIFIVIIFAFQILRALDYTTNPLIIVLLIIIALYFCYSLLLLKKSKTIDVFCFKKEWFYLIIIIITILIISFLKQIALGKIYFQTLREILYLFIPVCFVFIVVNIDYDDEKNYKFYIDVILISCLAFNLFAFYDKLTITNILSSFKFSIINSDYVFESFIPQIVVCTFIYYVFYGYKKEAVLSIILCFFGGKRIDSIVIVLFFIISFFFKKNRKISKIAFYIILLIMFFTPILFNLIYSDSFSTWFSNYFDINFFTFVMGRNELHSVVINNLGINFGYGSVNEMLLSYYYIKQLLHNEPLRLTIEVGYFGYFVFILFMLKLSFRNNWSVILIIIQFIIMLSSPLLNNFFAWIVFFLVLFTINRGSITLLNCGETIIKDVEKV